MRAARWHGRGDVRVEDVPDLGEPPAGWVRLRVEACGICGTDLEEYAAGPVVIPTSPHPLLGSRAPITLGHEMAGVVEYAAPDVTHLSIGTRVAVENSVWCGQCFWCVRGEHNLCPSMANLGLHADGGLAESVLVPAATCVPYADWIAPEEAALAEPLSVAVRALRRGGVGTGSRVGVVGAGAVGLLVVQVARALGADLVVAVDPHALRLALASSVGAHLTATPEEAESAVERATANVGLDVVVEAAGNQVALEQSLRLTRRGGRTVMVGVFHGTLQLDVMDMLLGEREVVGCVSHRVDTDFSEAVDLLGRGVVQARPLITDVIPLEDVVTRGFNALRDAPADHLKIVVTPSPS